MVEKPAVDICCQRLTIGVDERLGWHAHPPAGRFVRIGAGGVCHSTAMAYQRVG
jgi:hypothetical protein